jgi:phospholipase/carboxylesterase
MVNQIELQGPVNESNNETEQLIFFLHGWGSDGNDLIQISHHWKKEIHKTTFIAPNGPDSCPQNPSGRQWFDILTESNIKMHQELQSSFSLLDKYIDNQLNRYNLGKEDFFLVGFSQGTMLSLHASLRRKCKGVIGYSGAFLEGELPDKVIKNDILLIHGQLDAVVPVDRMKNAEKKLINFSNKLEIKVYEKLEHSINEEGLILGCNFIKKRF